MIVYEFWLKEEFKDQPFETLCDTFDKLGKIPNRWDDPRDEQGNPIEAPCSYATSKNLNTNWVQILFDDDTPEPIIIAIEGKINGLKDDAPFRKYDDDLNNDAPIETPKYFSLERVLRVRQRQKDGTLKRVEDVE